MYRIVSFLLFTLFIGQLSLAVNVSGTPSVQTVSTRSGSSTDWINPSLVTSNDNNYATTSNRLQSQNEYTDFLDLSKFNFNIPSTSVITGISVSMARRTNGGVSLIDDQIQLLIGGVPGLQNRASGLYWTITKTTITYGGTTDTWGQVLTSTIVNNAAFGIRIAVKRGVGTLTSNQYPEIDFVQMTVSYNSTLPVELLSFQASALTNGDRALKWSTATEINSSKFYLQRANESTVFETIGEIRSAGNSLSKMDYEFFDNEFNRSKILYYRLVQEDINGEQVTLPTRSVEPILKNLFNIYPNPTVDNVYLVAETHSDMNIEWIVVSDMMGKEVLQLKPMNLPEIAIKTLIKGTYIIKIYFPGDANPEVHRLIKL